MPVFDRIRAWAPFGAVPEIHADELLAALDLPVPPVLVDVRTRVEWEQSHIAGSISVPILRFDERLDGLGLDRVRFRELSPDGFDRLVFPGYEVATCRGVDRYEDRLAKDFPRDRDGLGRFFALLRGFRAAMSALSGKSARERLGALPHLPIFLRYGRATYGELLDDLVADPLLKAVLAAQGGDYGLPPSRASASS